MSRRLYDLGLEPMLGAQGVFSGGATDQSMLMLARPCTSGGDYTVR
jgi:hypothetical protein